MAKHLAAKTGHLVRFIMRLDRIRIPLWLIGLTFFTIIVPPALAELYSDQAQRDAMVESLANPAMIAMLGPADFTNYTIGVMTAHQMLLMTAVVAGLMGILLVTKHTRGDEEDGRIELIRSLPTGRLAYLNATIIVVFGTCVVLALVNGFGLYALGIETIDLEGSLLYGVALGGTALFFAGVAAVFAQLTESSRGALGYSIAFLLLNYLFRGITDVSNEALSWLSPLGWVTKAEVYGANNWWPMLLMIGASLVMFIIAYYLHAIRDLEQGFLPTRPGRRTASPLLLSPLGLAFRLQRTGFIAWAIGMYVLGASYGSVLGDLEAFIEGNELLEQMLAGVEGYSIVEQYMPMLMVVITLLATIAPLMAMNKLRGEEKKDRIDHVLSRAVSRTQLMGSYYVIAVVNGFVMISLAAIGLWSAGTMSMEEGLAFSTVYSAAIAYYPATLVMISIVAFLIGFAPKWTGVIWLYYLYTFLVVYMGGLFQLDDSFAKLTSFGHIPQAPIEDITFMPLLALCLVAGVLTVAGFIGYNKRDIQGS